MVILLGFASLAVVLAVIVWPDSPTPSKFSYGAPVNLEAARGLAVRLDKPKGVLFRAGFHRLAPKSPKDLAASILLPCHSNLTAIRHALIVSRASGLERVSFGFTKQNGSVTETWTSSAIPIHPNWNTCTVDLSRLTHTRLMPFGMQTAGIEPLPDQVDDLCFEVSVGPTSSNVSHFLEVQTVELR